MLRTRMRTLVLSAVLIATSASCFSDMGPTGISTPDVPKTNASLLSPVLSLTNSLVGTLFQCTPQPFAADTEVVGPAGGVITMGKHQLVIPAGALASRCASSARRRSARWCRCSSSRKAYSSISTTFRS